MKLIFIRYPTNLPTLVELPKATSRRVAEIRRSRVRFLPLLKQWVRPLAGTTSVDDGDWTQSSCHWREPLGKMAMDLLASLCVERSLLLDQLLEFVGSDHGHAVDAEIA